MFLAPLFIIITAVVLSLRSRAKADRRSAEALAAFDARISRLARDRGDRLSGLIEQRKTRDRSMHEALFALEMERVHTDLTEPLLALGRRISRSESAQDDAVAALVGRVTDMRCTLRERRLAADRRQGDGGEEHP